MSLYTADHRSLTDAEREYLHSVFIGSASDLILGGKGFVAEAAYDAAWNYLRGH